jgi:hypothetical protein
LLFYNLRFTTKLVYTVDKFKSYLGKLMLLKSGDASIGTEYTNSGRRAELHKIDADRFLLGIS